MSWKDFEKKVERGPIPAVLAILFVLFVTIAITGGYTLLKDWALQRYYAPQMESAKRHAFENNRSYVTGNIEELRRLRREYLSAPDGEKEILKDYILDQFDSFDRDLLDSQLNDFINELENK